jgi:hypothetical protein
MHTLYRQTEPPLEFKAAAAAGPRVAPRAHLASQGASPEDGNFVLPIPSTRRPPEVTTISRIGAEKEHAAASPSHHILKPVSLLVRIPLAPLCFALLCIETCSPESCPCPAPVSSPWEPEERCRCSILSWHNGSSGNKISSVDLQTNVQD